MDDKTVFKTLVIAAVSGTLGYVIYTKTRAVSGIIVTFMAAWLLYQFRSWEKAWTSLGNFQNPILFGINTAFATYIYSVWRQIPSSNSLYIAVAGFLLGGALSLMLSKYWNIGG